MKPPAVALACLLVGCSSVPVERPGMGTGGEPIPSRARVIVAEGVTADALRSALAMDGFTLSDAGGEQVIQAAGSFPLDDLRSVEIRASFVVEEDGSVTATGQRQKSRNSAMAGVMQNLGAVMDHSWQPVEWDGEDYNEAAFRKLEAILENAGATRLTYRRTPAGES